MSKEFKPGDLALIKHCRIWPEAIGRCVSLIEKVPAGEKLFFKGRLFENCGTGPAWLIHSDSGFPVHSRLFGLVTEVREPTALFQEYLLMPLKGDEQPAQVRQAERVQ